MPNELKGSEQWTISLGINAGYSLEGQTLLPEAEMAELYREEAERVMEETGIYISANMAPARSLYRSEWGCPAGGEHIYCFTGCRNPQFAEKEPYRAALELLARRLKKRLGQSAVYLTVQAVELEYLT